MARSDISSPLSSARASAEVSFTVSSDGAVEIDSKEDWSTLTARIASVPDRGTIRGMFMRQAHAWLPGSNPSRYLPFSNYSLREYMETLLKAAARRFPRARPAEALVQLGREVYPLFASSLAGGAIFGIANNTYRHVVELSPRAYPITLSPGRAEVSQSSEDSANVALRDVWVFPEFFHAGIWLGAMTVCRTHGTISVVPRSVCDVEFKILWKTGLN